MLDVWSRYGQFRERFAGRVITRPQPSLPVYGLDGNGNEPGIEFSGLLGGPGAGSLQ
jgi:hypothetical protein